VTPARPFADNLTVGRPTGVDAPTAQHTADEDLAAPRAVISAAAHAALSSIGPLTESARRSAESFRGGDLAGAHYQLTHTVSTLRTLALVTGMLTVTPGIGTVMKAEGDAVLSCLSATLDQLTACRERFDWEGVADVLERDIPALLCEWAAVLSAVQHAIRTPTRSLHSTSGRLLASVPAASEVQ
jgi:hypothetical protein